VIDGDDSLSDEEIEARKAEKRKEIEERMEAKAAEPKKRGDSEKDKLFGQFVEA
jgi:hypothetical protein